MVLLAAGNKMANTSNVITLGFISAEIQSLKIKKYKPFYASYIKPSFKSQLAVGALAKSVLNISTIILSHVSWMWTEIWLHTNIWAHVQLSGWIYIDMTWWPFLDVQLMNCEWYYKPYKKLNLLDMIILYVPPRDPLLLTSVNLTPSNQVITSIIKRGLLIHCQISTVVLLKFGNG